MMGTKPNAEHYFSTTPKSRPKKGLIHAVLRGIPFEFVTSSSVFSRKRLDTGTRLLIETMQLPEKGVVLDVGCGYGAVGIASARINLALRIIMADVNARAVALAKENIVRNKVTNSEVRLGHLYEPVEGLKFDAVLSNPPISAGLETVAALVSGAAGVLVPKGSLQVVIRSKIGGRRLLSVFHSTFGNCRVLSRESGYRVLIAEKK